MGNGGMGTLDTINKNSVILEKSNKDKWLANLKGKRKKQQIYKIRNDERKITIETDFFKNHETISRPLCK